VPRTPRKKKEKDPPHKGVPQSSNTKVTELALGEAHIFTRPSAN
jgi:hypothetical protein